MKSLKRRLKQENLRTRRHKCRHVAEHPTPCWHIPSTPCAPYWLVTWRPNLCFPQTSRLLQQVLLPTEPSHRPACYIPCTVVLKMLIITFHFLNGFHYSGRHLTLRTVHTKVRWFGHQASKSFIKKKMSNNSDCSLSLSSNLHKAGVLLLFY